MQEAIVRCSVEDVLRPYVRQLLEVHFGKPGAPPLLLLPGGDVPLFAAIVSFLKSDLCEQQIGTTIVNGARIRYQLEDATDRDKGLRISLVARDAPRAHLSAFQREYQDEHPGGA